MKVRLTRLTRHILAAALYGAAGAVLVLVVVFVFYMESQPDLDIWHLADLDEEYTASSGLETFAQYLALEERLFAQLDAQVYEKIPGSSGASPRRPREARSTSSATPTARRSPSTTPSRRWSA